MIINILKKLSEFNEQMFSGIDSFIESFNLPDWLYDAIVDSIHILPVLFIIFFIIEIIEFFYSKKINSFVKKSEKTATLIGSIAAIIPQCGFSVIASAMYIRKYLTKGSLIAIYLATSDEAIPILLSEPNKIKYIIPIISLKFVIAVFTGYLIDFILKEDKYIITENKSNFEEESEGCCKHSISKLRKRELFLHPLKHTLNIFSFILVITVGLNFIIEVYPHHTILQTILNKARIFEPIFTAIIGLIPNCAISIALTILLIKGTISFGSAMAGLLSNAGLGILVLFRNSKNFKDTLKIIYILLIISILSGYLINIFY